LEFNNETGIIVVIAGCEIKHFKIFKISLQILNNNIKRSGKTDLTSLKKLTNSRAQNRDLKSDWMNVCIKERTLYFNKG